MASYENRALEWALVEIDDTTLDTAGNYEPLGVTAAGDFTTARFAITDLSLPTGVFNEITEYGGRGYEVSIDGGLPIQEMTFTMSELVNDLWLATGEKVAETAATSSATKLVLRLALSREQDAQMRGIQVTMAGRIRESNLGALPTDGGFVPFTHVMRPVKLLSIALSRLIDPATQAERDKLNGGFSALGNTAAAARNDDWREIFHFDLDARKYIRNGVDIWAGKNAALGIA